MERESFENPEIAGILNEHFVSIKVDREQRPDLDHIYMSFTQAFTGHGGWPMSVFLTPEGKPFFAGTYFPPEDAQGRPGFKRVVSEISRAYRENREQILESAADITNRLAAALSAGAQESVLTPDIIARAADKHLRNSDPVNGGFGREPKFPHAGELSLLLRHYRRSGDLAYLQAAEKALMGMARGGIRDHLAGGFARYSVDARWIVPHFEKMLYDNALLVAAYADALQVTGNEYYLEVIRSTLDFMLSEMHDESGGFYSALDADSEGEEGRFYVWTRDEIESIIGNDADLFCPFYNVIEHGNFEGRNILHVSAESDRVRESSGRDDFDRYLADCRARLLAARDKRVRPLTDDKVLVSWNGMALSALARGYQVTGDARYLETARENARFVTEELYSDGSLTHAWRQGKHFRGEFLEDYAFYVRGLLDLYESDLSPTGGRWLEQARIMAERAIDLFLDSDGHFYMRPDGLADLIIRPKDETDGALPAAASVMIHNLLRLSRLTGDNAFRSHAESALRAISGTIERVPQAMTSALLALDFHLSDKIEIVVVGTGDEKALMMKTIYRRFLPNRVIAHSETGREDLPLFEGRAVASGEVRAYVCRNSVCDLPAEAADELIEQLQKL
jgi:uncharacterized protein YyaL (SSP411 family)